MRECPRKAKNPWFISARMHWRIGITSVSYRKAWEITEFWKFHSELFTGEGNNNLGSLFQDKPMEMGIWAVPSSSRINIQDFVLWPKEGREGAVKPHKSGFWEQAARQGMKGEFGHLNI